MPNDAGSRWSCSPWLGVVVGNTRLHWALFQGDEIAVAWHTPHLKPAIVEDLIAQNFVGAAWRSHFDPLDVPAHFDAAVGEAALGPPLSVLCASVVPSQTRLWQQYVGFRDVDLKDIPLANLYPTLGIDRALNLWGAGNRYGWPMLVIDAGTALTFTAGIQGRLLGGAILPGMATQAIALQQRTAVLPAVQIEGTLPHRWATDTPSAIQSGVVYGTLAVVHDFLRAWQAEQPQAQAVLTGGDGLSLFRWLQGTVSLPLRHDVELMFESLRCCRRQRL